MCIFVSRAVNPCIHKGKYHFLIYKLCLQFAKYITTR